MDEEVSGTERLTLTLELQMNKYLVDIWKSCHKNIRVENFVTKTVTKKYLKKNCDKNCDKIFCFEKIVTKSVAKKILRKKLPQNL